MEGDELGGQLRAQYDSAPGDVLVHPEEYFSSVRDLVQDGFTIRRFLDLCGVIEATVLNQRIIVVATTSQAAALMNASSFANDLMTEPFFTGLSIQAPPDLLGLQMDRIMPRIRIVSAQFPSWIHPGDPEDRARLSSSIALCESVFWEETLGIPYLPTVQQAPYFVSAQGLPERHCLYLEYGEARTRALTARLREEYETRALPVPPIALRVLRRAETPDEIGSSLLLERDKFARLREIRDELDYLTRDREVSPLKKRTKREQYQRRWRSEVRRVIGDDEAETVIAVPSTTLPADELAGLMSEAVASVVPLPKKAVGAIIKIAPWAIERLQSVPYRPMGTAMRKSLRTSPAAIDREVRRLFGHEVSETDLAFAHELTDALPRALALGISKLDTSRRDF